MGFLDRLFGTEPAQPAQPQTPQYARTGAPNDPAQSEDEQAIARYRYLLQTAPPETIEQVHAEAFSRLTDAQRQQVLAELSAQLPAAERPRSDDPQSMARAATRAEYMNPGFMERTLGGRGGRGGPGAQGGPSFGAMVGSSLLGTVAGYVIGSALVGAFFAPSFAGEGGSGEDGSGGESGDGSGDTASADAGGADAGAADMGGGFDGGGFDMGGDFGGDFGL